MNTLTGIEAERVNQILKHGIYRMNILSNVPIVKDDEFLLSSHRDVVRKSLERLWSLESEVKDELESSFQYTDFEMIKQLHAASKSVVRNISEDTEYFNYINSKRSISEGIGEAPDNNSVQDLIKMLDKLRERVLIRITSTVENETQNRIQYRELVERERKFQDMKTILMKKLDEVLQEKEKVTLDLDTHIRKLQLEIQQLTQLSSMSIKEVESEMNNSIQKVIEDHNNQKIQLDIKLNSSEKQMTLLIDKNKEEESKLRREKIKNENVLSQKISQYDSAMQKLTYELDDLNRDFILESKEYDSLVHHYHTLDLDAEKSEEEARLLNALQKRSEFGKWVIDIAIVRIQALVRGRRARLIVVKMRSKSKKAKKSKKKSKK